MPRNFIKLRNIATPNIRYYRLADGTIKSCRINKKYVKKKPSGFIEGLALTKDQAIDIFKNILLKSKTKKQILQDHNLSYYYLQKLLMFCAKNYAM